MNTTAINEAIEDAILKSIDGYEGNFSLDIEIDANTFVEVSGCYGIHGYCEDDYFNGTGAWVTTYADVAIDSCDVFTYDEDGNEVDNDIEPDLAKITREIERELK